MLKRDCRTVRAEKERAGGSQSRRRARSRRRRRCRPLLRMGSDRGVQGAARDVPFECVETYCREQTPASSRWEDSVYSPVAKSATRHGETRNARSALAWIEGRSGTGSGRGPRPALRGLGWTEGLPLATRHLGPAVAFTAIRAVCALAHLRRACLLCASGERVLD